MGAGSQRPYRTCRFAALRPRTATFAGRALQLELFRRYEIGSFTVRGFGPSGGGG
jgi:hypothetical protein